MGTLYKLLFLIIGVVPFALNAQPCGNPAPGTGESCQDPIDLCTGSIPLSTCGFSPNPPLVFCGGAAGTHNNSFTQFVASGTTVTFDFTLQSCQQNLGVQAVIFQAIQGDCNNLVELACFNPPGVAQDFTISANVVPGQSYLLMIDGYAGDCCNFDVISTGVDQNPASPPVPIIDGPTTLCEGDQGTYTVTNPASNAVYNWYEPVWLGGPTGQSITIDFTGQSGTVQVCVEASVACNPTCACIDVMIEQPPNVSVLPLNLCNDDGTGGSILPYDLSLNLGEFLVGLPPGATVDFFGSQFAAQNGSPTVSPIITQGGNYTFWLSVTTMAGCRRVLNNPLTVSIEDVQITAQLISGGPYCANECVDLNQEVQVLELSGAPGPYNITFHPDQGSALAGTNQLIPAEACGNDGINPYWVRLATPNGCFDVTPIVINFEEVPDIMVNQPQPICGEPPFTYELEDTDIIILTNPSGVEFIFYETLADAENGFNPLFFTEVVHDNPGTYSYWVVAESDGGCQSDPMEIVLNFIEAAGVEMTGGGDACQFDLGEINFTFTGVPPFEVEVEDNHGNVYTFTSNDLTLTEFVNLDEAGTCVFTVVSIVDDSGIDCAGNQDATVTFEVREAPEITISGSTDICEGECTDLTFTVNAGTGPFNVTYSDSDLGSDQVLTGIDDGFTVNVCPSGSAQYDIVAVEDEIGCVGDGNGPVDIGILEEVTVSNIQDDSCGVNDYIVSFDISGGDAATYVINGGAGTLIGNTFYSDPIPTGTPYNFSVSDGNACNTVDVSGTDNCQCPTRSGTMQNGAQIDLCEDEVAVAVHNGDQVLDNDDVLGFVLHTNSSGTLGTVLASGAIPEFGFDPATMTLGTTYYISSIAGNDDGMGNVDVNDLCLDVSPGTPVVWHGIPGVNLSGGNAVCPGDLMDFQLDFTGTGPFTVVYQAGGVTDSVVTNTNPHTFSIPVSAVGTIDLVSISTDYCDQMLTISQPTDLLDSPTVGPPSYECNTTNTGYTVSFTINGGNGNYQVLGGTGTLTGADFISDEIPSGTPGLFQVIDDNACDTIDVPVQFNCDCGTLTGTVDQAQEELCDGDLVTAQDLGGAMLDGNDVLEFILHDQSGTVLGTVIDRNSTGEFGFDGTSMNLGQIYYISLVAGDDSGNGQVDLMDPCLSVSPGKPVRWHAYPTANIQGGGVLTCQVSEVTLDGSASTGSNNLDYSWSTQNGVINGSTNGQTAIAAASGTYQLVVTDQLAGCADSITMDVTSDGSIPVVTIAPVDLLTCEITEVTLNAGGSSSGPDIQIQWTTGAGNIVSGANTLMPIVDAPGQYTLTLTDLTNDCEASGSITVNQDNAGITAVIAVTDILDCDTDQVTLDGSGSTSGPDITYTWSTPDGALVGNSNGATATASAAGTYVLLVEDQSSGCFAIDSATVQQNGLLPTDLDLTIIPISCHGESDGSIIINNVVGGEAPYQYSINGGPFNNLPSFASLGEGDHTITVIDANGCQFTTQVSLVEPDELAVTLGDDIFIQLGDSVQLEAQVNQPVDTFIWTGDINRSQQGQQDPWVSPTITLQYTVTVITQGGCVDEDQQLVIVERERPLFIPNVFSPNNDGINDYFMIYGGDEADEVLSLQVYSRWGELVYEGRNLTPGDEPAGWDGTFQGEMMNPGVFIYTAEVLFTDGVTEFYKGDFSLIR